MLVCKAGYPLFEPGPAEHVSVECPGGGVKVGDVGTVTEDGSFDVLFNVCPSQNEIRDPIGLDSRFGSLGNPDVIRQEKFSYGTSLFSMGVKRTVEASHSIYKCLESEGAVLELPLGATRFEARNTLGFKRLASLCAENWYRYAIFDRGREISNGSLYLVTACVKCKHCGIAVFHSPPAPEDYIKFNLTKCEWDGSASFIGKSCPHAELADATEREQNQCIFLRGFKIMLSQDVWDNAVANHSDAIATNLEASPFSSAHKGTGSARTANSREGNASGTANHEDCTNKHMDDGAKESDDQTNMDSLHLHSGQTNRITPMRMLQRVILQVDFSGASPVRATTLGFTFL